MDHHDREPSTGRGGRRQLFLLLLASVFLGNALIAEMVGGKLFELRVPGLAITLTLSAGALLWPVVFVTSDLVNEYFGRAGVRRLSFIAAAVIAYSFGATWITGLPAAAPFSPVGDAAFDQVFRQSRWIVVGSIAAFLVAQLIDVSVFWAVRRATGPRLLWLRATGSTVVSQLIDTFVVGFIGLHVPYLLYGPGRGIDFATFVKAALSGYAFKFVVAVAVTPFLYAGHAIAGAWLGAGAAEALVRDAAAAEEGRPPA